MFTVMKTVEFSEVGPDYKIRLTKLLDYFQDITIRQSNDLNAEVGVKELREKGMCWVLSSWQVVVNRYPELGEKVYVSTAPTEFKGFLGTRCFTVRTEEGEELVLANSIWSFVDTQNMKLIRIPEYVSDAYEIGAKLDMEYAPRKIKTPEIQSITQTVNIEYHNIDINNHVNNAQYIGLAEDIVPLGRRCRQMRAEYRSAAKYKDEVLAFVNVNEDQTIYTVTLADKDKNPLVLVEFTI